MQTERREAEMREEGNTACPSCHAVLVAGMRFCRMCGYRLGEGVEEYAATQRFDTPPTAAAQTPPATDPFAPRTPWGAQPIQPASAVPPPAPFAPIGGPAAWNTTTGGNTKHAGWWTWLILALVIMTVVGIASKAARTWRANRAATVQAQTPANSFLAEVDGLDTADGGGVFIVGLAGPNSSLERAGLIGGDIITHFDGKQVRDEGALRRLIGATPPGKAVEIVFLRDGATNKTVWTAADRRDWHELEPVDSRPGGRGVLGVRVGDRVRLPELNIYGVELDGVNRNQPGHIAGLQKNDVVIEFNGKPVRTPGDLRLRIYEAEPGTTANVTVIRAGQRLTIPVKVGWGKDPD